MVASRPCDAAQHVERRTRQWVNLIQLTPAPSDLLLQPKICCCHDSNKRIRHLCLGDNISRSIDRPRHCCPMSQKPRECRAAPKGRPLSLVCSRCSTDAAAHGMREEGRFQQPGIAIPCPSSPSYLVRVLGLCWCSLGVPALFTIFTLTIECITLPSNLTVGLKKRQHGG